MKVSNVYLNENQLFHVLTDHARNMKNENVNT